MPVFLVLLAFSAGVLVSVLRGRRVRSFVFLSAALGHGVGVASLWFCRPPAQLNGFLEIDALGLLALSVTSSLFVATAFATIGYARNVPGHSERLLMGGLLFLLSAMTLVTISRHLGLFWVGMGMSTLASAPLINFHRTPHGLEATWKYLLICSVGVALALLGTLFLAISSAPVKTLFVDELVANASSLSLPWFKVSVIFLLVGYGTKIGLAPFHTWKPDAYGEAPAPVGALMSGALTSCAYLAILRVCQICGAAGQREFAGSILIFLGALSLATAAVFILKQADFSRILAYSSVEHVGILALAAGVGGTGYYGGLLHMVNNGFSKGLIFLVMGNLTQAFGTRRVKEIHGVLRTHPRTGALLVTAFLAVTGIPPFGTFYSEFIILQSMVFSGHDWTAVFYLFCLGLIFTGLAAVVLKMAQGEPAPGRGEGAGKESWMSVAPPLVLAAVVLMLGVYLPPFLEGALREAAGALEGA
ncbi:MAG: hydrogenase [Candidatus Omnitrophica bacterium]|nr:hydrogenase [Candidatus Omnitrophota bacterium]